jgi:hypothetical protein
MGLEMEPFIITSHHSTSPETSALTINTMKATILTALALSTIVAGLTCPTNSGGGCGQYTVSGLGARKQQIRNTGGTTRDLAIAMMETEKMSTDYVWVSRRCVVGFVIPLTTEE